MVEFFEGDVYRDLTRKGYSQEEIYSALSNPQSPEYNSYNYQPASSMFAPAPAENLIQYQLELDNILERMEHILRGDKLMFKDGREVWVKCTDPKSRLFNEDGVSEIMRILSSHINRNTILSDYDEKRIMKIVGDLGNRLNDLIFMKYDKFGLDTIDKRKIYTQVLFDILDMVESCYRRAKDGAERQSLRESRMVNQQEVLSNQEMGMVNKPNKSVFNPFTWGKR